MSYVIVKVIFSLEGREEVTFLYIFTLKSIQATESSLRPAKKLVLYCSVYF